MKCPGQDSRFWGAEAIFEGKCPHCNEVVEFFKDEGSRKCRKCGNKVLNPKMDFGCAAYCKFASQCLGDDIPPELLAKRTDLLRDRVAMEVKKLLGRDFKRIGRTLKVAGYADTIRKAEGADPAIVTLAAYLTAFSDRNGRKAAGMDAATDVLSRAGATPELSEQVLEILNNLHEDAPAGGNVPGTDDSLNFKCVHDAIRIAEFEESLKKQAAPDANAAGDIEGSILTASGRDALREVLLESPAGS
jgi:hypothetical protein